MYVCGQIKFLSEAKDQIFKPRKIMTNDKIKEVENNFNRNLKELKSGINGYLSEIKGVGESFGGPSIYFYHRALQEMEKNFLKLPHIEAIYAMLPAWGMHKMGKTKTKIVVFDEFKRQIEARKSQLFELRGKRLSEVNIGELSELLVSMRFSESDSRLVSSSKVLHHIIPNLICPIDRQHSITFLLQDKSNFHRNEYKNDDEKDYANIFLSGMRKFIEVDDNKVILEEQRNTNDFNTSLTKIFDNLIMVFVREERNKIRE